MTNSISTQQMKKIARIAGILYLIIFITAGFAQGFVREGLIVTGDPSATFVNITSSEGLFRSALISDLTAFLSDAIISVILYFLLRPVSRVGAAVMASLRLLAHPAIAVINLINHYAAIEIATGTYFTSWSPEQLESMVYFFTEMHSAGYLIAGAFFGVHLLILGILLFRSENFPKWLGILVAIAGPAYIAESTGNLVWPGNEALFSTIVLIAAVTAELALTLWLLLKGVKTPVAASGH